MIVRITCTCKNVEEPIKHEGVRVVTISRWELLVIMEIRVLIQSSLKHNIAIPTTPVMFLPSGA